jgi:protein subunit release factor B
MKTLIKSVTKKDFTLQFFRCGGNGGQKVNKTSSGVRIIHKESGSVGECRNNRSQHQNLKEAFKRLTESPKFKLWINKIAYEYNLGKTVEQKVEEMCNPGNIKIEVVGEDGKWVEEGGGK